MEEEQSDQGTNTKGIMDHVASYCQRTSLASYLLYAAKQGDSTQGDGCSQREKSKRANIHKHDVRHLGSIAIFFFVGCLKSRTGNRGEGELEQMDR